MNGYDDDRSSPNTWRETRTRNKILLIEDDPGWVQLITMGLEQHNFEVTAAGSGLEGLQMAYETHPDLVILDIRMPEMDGWQTCQRLREISDVPIIILTARCALEEDVVRGLKLGADDYLFKSVSLPELAVRIEAILRRSNTYYQAPHEACLYSNGELRIDFLRHKVLVSGKEVPLTPTEFKLLVCLAKHEGRVLPHSYLLTQVWGAEYKDELNYLKLYISYLRKKLEKNPSQPELILTEWGIGYYLRTSEDRAAG
jgi:two-component system KDP operon response regulator KdpE